MARNSDNGTNNPDEPKRRIGRFLKLTFFGRRWVIGGVRHPLTLEMQQTLIRIAKHVLSRPVLSFAFGSIAVFALLVLESVIRGDGFQTDGETVWPWPFVSASC